LAYILELVEKLVVVYMLERAVTLPEIGGKC
jgi:hypothetical protein